MVPAWQWQGTRWAGLDQAGKPNSSGDQAVAQIDLARPCTKPRTLRERTRIEPGT